MEPVKHTPLTRIELARAVAYALLLLWLNFYIARDFFSGHTAHMNSMQGFWTALAGNTPAAWFHPTWWPYWDCGIPLEAAYSPLFPWLGSIWSALLHVPVDMALSSIAGLAYILAPLSLFAMAWGLTRAASQLLRRPDLFAHLTHAMDRPRWRFPLGPHLGSPPPLPGSRLGRRAALARPRAAAPRHLISGARARTSPPDRLRPRRRLHRPHGRGQRLRTGDGRPRRRVDCRRIPAGRMEAPRHQIAAIGVYAYLLVMAFVPPSVLRAIAESTAAGDEARWTLGSLTALAAALLGFTILRYALRRTHASERVSFFAYFACLAGSVPLAAAYLHRRLMPQPVRYKFELELGLALVLAFAGRALLARVPAPIRRAAILLLLAVAAEQIVAYRKLEKSYLFPQDVKPTVEYRASTWAASHLHDVRVFFPGSVAQWANAFTNVPQLTGGSFSIATNQSQQNAAAAIVFEAGDLDGHAQLSLTWLKAYGIGAIAVAAPGSAEYWKAFAHPAKFDSLPALWSESGVTIRGVPARSASLTHVVPESAISRHSPQTPEDAAEAARYVTALEDPSIPEATLNWQTRERIVIHAIFAPGQVLSIQEGYSPGWRATVAGRHPAILKDGLGLMWLNPECKGACEITLEYNGGPEWWLCHALSALALASLATWTFARRASDRAP